MSEEQNATFITLKSRFYCLQVKCIPIVKGQMELKNESCERCCQKLHLHTELNNALGPQGHLLYPYIWAARTHKHTHAHTYAQT